MKRRLMRMPLDFNWPRDFPWPGYVNPMDNYRPDCQACEGTGYALGTASLHEGETDADAECLTCRGEGHFWICPEARARYEAWVPFDPPKGDGYQLWKTTSEGSPVSPVFTSLDALCVWCADNETTFAYHRTTPPEWHGLLVEDYILLASKK